MTKSVLRFPEDVRAFFARRYRNQHREWLAETGTWPLVMLLGCPTEAEARLQGDAVREWVLAWRRWEGPGKLVWCERRWRTLGPQSLPEKLVLDDAQSLAAWIGEDQRWNRAWSRHRQMVSRWPAVTRRLTRYFDALASYSDADML